MRNILIVLVNQNVIKTLYNFIAKVLRHSMFVRNIHIYNTYINTPIHGRTCVVSLILENIHVFVPSRSVLDSISYE